MWHHLATVLGECLRRYRQVSLDSEINIAYTGAAWNSMPGVVVSDLAVISDRTQKWASGDN